MRGCFCACHPPLWIQGMLRSVCVDWWVDEGEADDSLSSKELLIRWLECGEV